MGNMRNQISDIVVAVRGGGDLATGVVQKLYRSGFKVVILETDIPLAIRRTVALCTAVLDGTAEVEGMKALVVETTSECFTCWDKGLIPIIVDNKAQKIEEIHPTILVDAILAKKNLGTHRRMAPITIALGPGFVAMRDVDIVIETMRGHHLGRLYEMGTALPNTGVPGEIGGKSVERVIHSPANGHLTTVRKIGDIVKKNELLFYIADVPVYSPLNGVLRGLISQKVFCHTGLKIADVDPRPANQVDCYSISDKARALGGATLEAIFLLNKTKNIF